MMDDLSCRVGAAWSAIGRAQLRTASLAALLCAFGVAGLRAVAVAATGQHRSIAEARTVYFQSGDGHTRLVAYAFEPAGAGPHPAVVMLHGRAGPYSSTVQAACAMVAEGQTSPCSAATLSKRHRMWGEYWAAHGDLAVLVDSFGPRGRAHGYGRHSHEDPDRDAVNERTVRPLDAEGALAWLAGRADVRADRILLQGWSNGASTTLNTMYRQATGAGAAGGARFRAALALYPGCGPGALIPQHRIDREVWVFLGSADEEVSPTVCANVLGKDRSGLLSVTVYDGASHDFDDPGAVRQATPANRVARDDVMNRAAGLFDALGR